MAVQSLEPSPAAEVLSVGGRGLHGTEGATEIGGGNVEVDLLAAGADGLAGDLDGAVGDAGRRGGLGRRRYAQAGDDRAERCRGEHSNAGVLVHGNRPSLRGRPGDRPPEGKTRRHAIRLQSTCRCSGRLPGAVTAARDVQVDSGYLAVGFTEVCAVVEHPSLNAFHDPQKGQDEQWAGQSHREHHRSPLPGMGSPTRPARSASWGRRLWSPPCGPARRRSPVAEERGDSATAQRESRTSSLRR